MHEDGSIADGDPKPVCLQHFGQRISLALRLSLSRKLHFFVFWAFSEFDGHHLAWMYDHHSMEAHIRADGAFVPEAVK